MSQPVVAVFGSLNMDFVVTVGALPAPGQTVLGGQFQMLPGGKGANQAYACGRLRGPGVQVRMAGRVGYDLFADHLKASLAGVGVDVTAVHATRQQPTGVALIAVDAGGQNTIIVAPGANQAFSAAEAGELRKTFRGAAYALLQLEVPYASVQAALQVARQEGCRTILDPAPAPDRDLPAELWRLVDVVTPNETEACLLAGRPAARIPLAEAHPAAAQLRERLGVHTVILKLGDQGSYWWDGVEGIVTPAFSVTAVDATAAGDTFNGALAVQLAEGRAVRDALRFASAAAALSTTQTGAQASIPARPSVEAFLAEA
jgi:ribokinase